MTLYYWCYPSSHNFCITYFIWLASTSAMYYRRGVIVRSLRLSSISCNVTENTLQLSYAGVEMVFLRWIFLVTIFLLLRYTKRYELEAIDGNLLLNNSMRQLKRSVVVMFSKNYYPWIFFNKNRCNKVISS